MMASLEVLRQKARWTGIGLDGSTDSSHTYKGFIVDPDESRGFVSDSEVDAFIQVMKNA